MAKTTAERVREHRHKKRVTLQKAAAIVATIEAPKGDVYILPAEVTEETVRRALMKQVLDPLTPSEGGGVLVQAAKALLEDARERRKEAREAAERAKVEEAPLPDFGLDNEPDARQ